MDLLRLKICHLIKTLDSRERIETLIHYHYKKKKKHFSGFAIDGINARKGTRSGIKDEIKDEKDLTSVKNI